VKKVKNQMQKATAFVKRFWQDEKGMGTIEVVILIAVLVAVALIFKEGITSYVNRLMRKFFDEGRTDVESDGSGYTGP